MTTSVSVTLPTPNHKRVKVESMHLNSETGEEIISQTIELEHGQTSAVFHVWDGQFIKITEID